MGKNSFQTRSIASCVRHVGQVHLAVHDMREREPRGVDDGLQVQERLAYLAFDGAGEPALGVASALPRDVEEVAGEDARAVRPDHRDARRRDRRECRSPFPSRLAHRWRPATTPSVRAMRGTTSAKHGQTDHRAQRVRRKAIRSATSCAVMPSWAAPIMSDREQTLARLHAVGRDDLGHAAHAANHQRVALLDEQALDRESVLRPDGRARVAMRDAGIGVDDGRGDDRERLAPRSSRRAPGPTSAPTPPSAWHIRHRVNASLPRVASPSSAATSATVITGVDGSRGRDLDALQRDRVGVVDAAPLQRRQQVVVGPVVRQAIEHPPRRRLLQRALRARPARSSRSRRRACR